MIAEKLGPRVRKNFFPPEPDRLFAALRAVAHDERGAVERVAVSFMQTLMQMALDERKLVAHLFIHGCRTQLPDNIHISLDIVRRDLDVAPTEIVERFRAMASLGIYARQRVAAAEVTTPGNSGWRH